MRITEITLDSFPWLQQMRQQSPLLFDEETGGYQVFKYNEVQRVLSDYAVFSSQRSGEADLLGASIVSLDPPRHRQLRTLVTVAFTPRTVARLEERIATIVTELLDKVESAGQLDLVDDLAYPLPAIVIAELLGVPAEDREQFRHWSDQIVGNISIDPTYPPLQEMGAYFYRLLEPRRTEPRDDLISALLAAQVDGEQLTEVELLGFCILLLVAGHETTTTLLGNAWLTLDEHPAAVEELRADRELLPGAIEEVLRYRSPLKMMFRTTIQEAELCGQTIPTGKSVLAWIASANRDEEQFPNPDTFDIHRTPNRHLAFGYGIHFCLGAPLARLEARIALDLMLQRWQDIRRVPGVPLEQLTSFVTLGLRHLPMTFTKR